MKALDDMIRDAARGTAAEITPDGVPPLHLPDSPRRGWRGTGRTSRHAGRAGRWHLAAPLAAAAAVIAVVSVAVALTGSGPARHPAPAGHQVSASPGHGTRPGQSARLDQETVDYYLPATGAQYTTGAQIETLQLTLTAACTARSGFQIPHFRSWAATYTAAIYLDNSQFPDLAVISRARTLGAGSVGPLPRPAGASLRALDAAFSRCQNAVRRAFVQLDNAGQQLGNTWGTIVMRIQASAPVRATLPGLRSCAARYGWPAEPYGGPNSTINSFSDFTSWVAAYLDGASSRGTSGARLSAHWAHVFVQCGRATVAVQERLQSLRRAIFLQQHSRQVQALEATASRVVAGLDRKYGTAAR